MKKTVLLKLQLKRLFRVYPAILLITAAMLLISGIAGYCTLNRFSGENRQKVTVAVVGNIDGTVLEVGLEAIRNLDSSRFTVDIVNMDEESAVTALKQNKIAGYLLVPDRYVRDIMNGKNTPATFVTSGSSERPDTLLVTEIAEIVSGLLTETQAGVYSMQTVLKDNGLKANVRKATNKLNLSYATSVLGRDSLFDIELLGISGLSSGGYYLAAFIMFFILLMGISFSRLLCAKNISFSRILNISGVSPFHQVMCEYGAYFTLLAVTLLLFSAVGGFFSHGLSMIIPELSGTGVIDFTGFVVMILPVIAMVGMMQFAFYEFSDNPVTAVLVQFMLAVGLGYISGCFYPISFFPDIIRKIGSVLPSGAGFTYLRNCLSGNLQFADFAGVAVYFIIFTTLSVFARKRRIAGDAL